MHRLYFGGKEDSRRSYFYILNPLKPAFWISLSSHSGQEFVVIIQASCSVQRDHSVFDEGGSSEESTSGGYQQFVARLHVQPVFEATRTSFMPDFVHLCLALRLVN